MNWSPCLVEDWRSADTVRCDTSAVRFILGQRRDRRLPDVRGRDRDGVRQPISLAYLLIEFAIGMRINTLAWEAACR
jgi:hypothetical protein